jgi:Nif-specific regulatory protein
LNSKTCQFAVELVDLAETAESLADLLDRALPMLRSAVEARFVALVAFKQESWSIESAAGAASPLPLASIADALEREQPVTGDDWLAAPVWSAPPPEVLVVQGWTDARAAQACSLALAAALRIVRNRVESERRKSRLEAIVEITQKWRGTNETEPLLVQMARAATQLFSADRASIFLWDKANRVLVGRPALGVEGGELRIPDDTGVVGRVVHSGEPVRVAANQEKPRLDPSLARQVGYKVKTILCVPLTSGDGRRLGAFELLNKRGGEFSDDDERGLVELAAHAAVALENTRQFESLVAAHRQVVELAAEQIQLIGHCPPIEAVRSTISRIADTDLAVLLLGENGTGKEVVSRLIHYSGRRRDRPFIAVNCAALAESLLESELFGHEKGAFTDAHQTRRGKFELASGGTLFLDEIGDMSAGGQAKLLRVLEEKVVERVGGSTPIPIDVRVITATNQDLAEMVRKKRFREDLYFRLCVVTLELPPLRERGDDVMLLAQMFLDEFCGRARRKTPKFSAAAKKRMLSHPWPGNVRELRNLMERMAYLTTSDRIEAGDLDFILTTARGRAADIEPDLTLADATREFQVRYIHQAIERAAGRMSRAAGDLGLHRSNLYRKMRQLEMPNVDED